MDTQLLDIDMLSNSISECTLNFLQNNKQLATNIPNFVELIIGAHLTSMYNHLNSFAKFKESKELKQDIEKLYSGFMQSLDDIGMFAETYSYSKKGH